MTLSLVLAAGLAHLAAATVTWGGGGVNTLWSTNTNWDGAVVPANGDTVVFPASPTTTGAYTATYDSIPGLSLAAINIVTAGTAWTLNVSGSPHAMMPLAINVSGPLTSTISAPIDIVTGTTLAIAIANGSELNLQGVISGDGALLFSGPASAQMTGTLSNTLTGTTTVQSGTLNLARTAGATSIVGPLIINSSTATVAVITAAGTANAIDDACVVTVAANAIFDLTNAAGTDQAPDNETIGALVGAGTVILGSHTLGTSLSLAPSTFSGVISGTGGFHKSGTGTQILSGANSYTGSTSASGGELTILGIQPQSAVALSGGKLSLANAAQVGACSSTSATAANDLVLGNQPGSSNLASCGMLDLSGGGGISSHLNVYSGAGATSSSLSVTGLVTLTGATLHIDTSASTPALGTVWTIIANDLTDPVVGTFAGAPEGTTLVSATNSATFLRISYVGGSGNDVTLTAVAGSSSGSSSGTSATGTSASGTSASGTSAIGTATAAASTSSTSSTGGSGSGSGGNSPRIGSQPAEGGCGVGGGAMGVLVAALLLFSSRRRLR